MANDCWNRVTITGPDDALAAVAEFVRSDESEFDFERVLPTPEALYGTLVLTGPIDRGEWALTREVEGQLRAIPEGERAALRAQYGSDNWHDWHCERWGTKWNAYRATSLRSERALAYRFVTAWDPPTPVLEALARRFPAIRIRHQHATEEIGCAWYEGRYWFTQQITASATFVISEQLELYPHDEAAKA